MIEFDNTNADISKSMQGFPGYPVIEELSSSLPPGTVPVYYEIAQSIFDLADQIDVTREQVGRIVLAIGQFSLDRALQRSGNLVIQQNGDERIVKIPKDFNAGIVHSQRYGWLNRNLQEPFYFKFDPESIITLHQIATQYNTSINIFFNKLLIIGVEVYSALIAPNLDVIYRESNGEESQFRINYVDPEEHR